MARNSLDIPNRLKVSRSGIVEEVFFWDGLVWNLRGSGCLYFKVSLYNRESVCALLKIF